jgi:hypothetical protein
MQRVSYLAEMSSLLASMGTTKLTRYSHTRWIYNKA